VAMVQCAQLIDLFCVNQGGHTDEIIRKPNYYTP
jgi:hypothetical protein